MTTPTFPCPALSPRPELTAVLQRGRRVLRCAVGLLGLLLVLASPNSARAQTPWAAVPPVDFSTINVNQFADHELDLPGGFDVPYYLYHLHTVASAVVETGPYRGYLYLAATRSASGVRTSNASIQSPVTLAYFYCIDRPWNPYRGHLALRQRLEAMVWYNGSNGSYGSMAMAQTLELLVESGQPFDPALLTHAQGALRAALMALFTRQDMKDAARRSSNELSAAYFAALTYLKLWPGDATLDAAFVAAFQYAIAKDQSPAGSYYEREGTDFPYSGEHETNFRFALPLLRQRADLLALAVASDLRWNEFMGANFVPVPGAASPTYLTNAGINTRSSSTFGSSSQNQYTARHRPWSEFNPISRAFSFTTAELTARRAAKRAQLASSWGSYGPFSADGASYNPTFVFDAVRDLTSYAPSDAERSAGIASLPYQASTRFIRFYRDPASLTVGTIRRPAYYACFNFGQPLYDWQTHGLGLLWSPDYGPALQNLPAPSTPISINLSRTWGTRGALSVYEGYIRFFANFRLSGLNQAIANGVSTVADGVPSFDYPLRGGLKTVTFGEDTITVALTQSGGIYEFIPLLQPDDAVQTTSSDRLTFTRPNGASLQLRLLTAGATFTVDSKSSVLSGLSRRSVTVSSTGQLTYELSVTNAPFTAGTLAPPVAESCTPPNNTPDPGEMITLALPITSRLGSATTALTGTLRTSASVQPLHGAVSYGVVAAGAAATREFDFTVQGGCGSEIELVLDLQDGAQNLGSVRYLLRLGALVSVTTLLENFDAVSAPALPLGWVSSVPTATSATSGWATSATSPDTAPFAVFATPTDFVSEKRLDSPAYTVPAGVVQLQLRHRWDVGYSDGAVLELSVDGGPYEDVLAAGANFLSGRYDSTLRNDTQNPLGGRAAWTSSYGGDYTTTLLQLPSSFAGKALRLRFRLGSDNAYPYADADAVWRVDSLSFIASSFQCASCPPPVPTLEQTLAAAGLSGDDALPTADPDRDGVPNLLEYAFGLSPAAPDASPVAAVPLPLGRLALGFPRGTATTGLTYVVEASGDLAEWTPLARHTPALGWENLGAASIQEAAPVGTSAWCEIADRADAPAGPRFLRLRVTY